MCVFSFSFLATEPFISEKVNAQLDGFFLSCGVVLGFLSMKHYFGVIPLSW